MRKKTPIILLAVFSILAVHSGPGWAAGEAAKSITLLYSGDMNGNIRPVNE
ncbi:hypothetical protein [Desulfococcus sp.]|uniref:hypothetical protein n=1 Tax=Desulfococcus sp. TaxID=2025834 RepID=UPI0035940C15